MADKDFFEAQSEVFSPSSWQKFGFGWRHAVMDFSRQNRCHVSLVASVESLE
jgi:hypothetical protein